MTVRKGRPEEHPFRGKALVVLGAKRPEPSSKKSEPSPPTNRLLRANLAPSGAATDARVDVTTAVGRDYLPDLRRGEVEVASITIKSTTQDVTRLCARRGKSRILYRVMDEYEGATLDAPFTRTSTLPLTLDAMTEFFLGAWNLFAVLETNFAPEYPLEEVHGFFTGHSESYPDFDKLLHQRVDTWLDELSIPMAEKVGPRWPTSIPPESPYSERAELEALEVAELLHKERLANGGLLVPKKDQTG